MHCSVTTMGESTLGDEEQSPAVQKKPSEWIPREDFEEVLSKLRILTEENAVLKMREEALAGQVMKSKQQVVALMNDLYAVEKRRNDFYLHEFE
mmetsp:Transcript_27345/g.20492  ORF Transcript_27345/g.20492 Transcript_27345/m.20492 type:complete len:94 (+) Transcript_27345:1238-1519(+)